MSYYIASDHAGVDLKDAVCALLRESGCDVHDLGPHTSEVSVDYPDYANRVATKVVESGAQGILICGTGIGMSIAANKVAGVRAALAHDVFTADMARQHNNANILVLGARVLASEVALEMVKTWREGSFVERHQRRLDKVSQLELPPGATS